MACPECEKNKKKTAKDFTKAVVEIKNPDKLVLFRKVVVPASMGTEEQFPASVGKFSNVLLQYEANGDTYLYSSDGIPTQLSSDVSELQRQLDELKIVVTNEIADRIAADGTINSRIDQEILDRQAADNDLGDALAAEVAARKAADNTLDGKITTEKNARIAADNTLQTNINNEATARAAADSTLDGKITTEKEAREAADQTLQTNINNEATTRANADTALGTRITNETTARQNADNTLDGKITTEANTRSAADSALAEDISTEVTRAKAAETALGGRIDDEATTRAAADTTLDGKITAEATARANADSTLDGKITDEATTRANADTALGTRIDNEVTARTNADTALGTRIDNEATARANADTALEGKLNRSVLYDLEMQTDANNVTFVEDKVNLKTGATTTERDVIPAASRTTAGTISASEYISLVDAEEKITALLEGAVAIDNLPANPTQQQLTDAWLAATGKTGLINRASIYDSANQLVHTYYTNVSEWEDSPAGAQITIDQFTNSAAGIIKGSTTDGNVSANLDGTGTVSGWTALKNTVAGKQDTLTAGSNISISGSTISATDTTYSAGTGLSLTGTTFAVDTTTIAQKSDIPTVNNATLTIQKNGTTVKTFTANASTNVTANITVPTKTSDITNDSNYVSDANYVHTDNNFTTTLKNKLDGIAAGAEVNQNAFSNVKVGGTTVAADSKTDTLELVAGSNVTLTPDATNDKVTIAATDTNTTYTFANGTNGFTVTPSGGSAQTVTVTPSIANATSSANGLMSSADKSAFDTMKTVVRKLYGDGTSIPASADLNTATYLTVGRYKCSSTATVETLTNCPTTQAFMMDVYNTLDTSIDNQTTASWTSRTRKILDYVGNEWVQSVTRSSGTLHYNDWMKIAHTWDIPTVNNATLTIQKNGTNVQTFTANSSTNKTANITVPTKVTDLTDATNYVAKDGDFYVTGEGSNFSMTGTSQNVYADLKVKGDTQQTTYTGKNLNNGVSQGYFINTAATGCGKTDNDSGVAIAVQANTNYTVSTTTTQARYRVAVVSTLPTSSATVAAYNGINKDNKSESITINSGSYTYLVVNATDLSTIQVEAGSSATAFEPYVGGVPAPNPDYPQEVEVVTGRQVISSCGTNFYNVKDLSYISVPADIFTVDEDGWITFDSAKDPSTTSQKDYAYYTHNLPLKPSTQYSVIMEIKEVSGTSGFIDPYSRYIGHQLGQFTTEVSVQLNDMHAGDVYVWHPTTYANFPDDVGLRTYVRKPANASRMKVTFRLSVVADTTVTTSSFKYVPFTGKAVEINLGKNLFDKNNPNILEAYVDANTSVITSNNLNRIVWIPCEPNTTYTVQRVATPSWNRGVAWTEVVPANGVQTYGYVQGSAGALTITTGATAKYLVYRVYQSNSDSSTTLSNVLSSVQIEESTYATPYAPYFTPIELCKIGTYQDYLYPSGGKWYLHKETVSNDVNFNNTTNYNGHNGSHITLNYNRTDMKRASTENETLTKSNTLAGASMAQTWSGTVLNSVSAASNGDYLQFAFPFSYGSTWAELVAYLANYPTTVYYVLATPTDTEITNPLLVAQLDDLWRNLQSGTNTTNVNVEGDLPAILGVTAFTNTLASAMAGINERMNRLPAIPQITMTTTDPGEGQTLADNHYIAVYE